LTAEVDCPEAVGFPSADLKNQSDQNALARADAKKGFWHQKSAATKKDWSDAAPKVLIKKALRAHPYSVINGSAILFVDSPKGKRSIGDYICHGRRTRVLTVSDYYHTLESRIGYKLILGGTRHFGYLRRGHYDHFLFQVPCSIGSIGSYNHHNISIVAPE